MTKVLVVDDEPDIRELLRINLELDGHEVVTAVDGPDGLNVLREEMPDVVLLDVMMPGLSGWEVLSRIKADPDGGLSSTPVIMLTALSDDMDQIRGGIEGAIRYVTKPFDLTTLRREVREAVEGDPEPVKRRRAQNTALAKLARVEAGGDTKRESTGARPRLTRLERAPDEAPAPPKKAKVAAGVTGLSEKQRELLSVVAATPTVRAAAEELQVSRSNVYASLRRIARKLGVRSVPELVLLARSGDIDTTSAAG